MVGHEIKLIDASSDHVTTNMLKQITSHSATTERLVNIQRTNIRRQIFPVMRIIFNDTGSTDNDIST